MNAIVERVLCCILFLLVVLGVIVMHINPDEDADVVETQESTTCEEKETVIAPLPDYPLIESKESEIIGGYRNGMPCEVNKVPKESEEETHEQETGEEVGRETVSEELGMDGCFESETHADTTEATGYSSCPTTMETAPATQETQAVLQTEAEPIPEVTETAPVQTPLYAVNGAVLDESIQIHLWNRLCEHGIGWFMPYAIMIAYQESRFNPRAENANGQDKGLFQYRLKFYSGSDIFNPYEQIDIFAQQMANRANAGCSVNEMISRHMMSDYGTYNQTYVDQVLQHQVGLVLISN